ncbi:MAG TPA: AI-2E family transporter [Polyangiaceae bacterium]|nr:AI-2E family transporter [Polyangiaceae bacterium]
MPLPDDRATSRKAITVTLQLAAMAAWIALCARFIAPFFFPVVWGAVLATAIWPLFIRLFHGRRKVGAVAVVLFAWAALLIPTWLIVEGIAESIVQTARRMAAGEFPIPPPDKRLLAWPVVGKRLYVAWEHLVQTPTETLSHFVPQLRALGRSALQSAGDVIAGVLEGALSIGIAGIFLANADPCHSGLTRVAERLAPEKGGRFVELAASTVRGVAQGVIGTALIQSFAAALGLFLANVPGAGLWSGIVLLVAVMQLPPLLILGPISAYVFSHSGTSVGIVFLIWSILVNVSDGLIKPFVLGRGQSVPTLVILLGAIGGMITDGVIGLFVGAVVLAVGYELAAAWLREGEARAALDAEGLPTVPESPAPRA